MKLLLTFHSLTRFEVVAGLVVFLVSLLIWLLKLLGLFGGVNFFFVLIVIVVGVVIREWITYHHSLILIG